MYTKIQNTVVTFLISTFVCVANSANYKVVPKQVGATTINFVHNADQDETYYSLKADYSDVEKMAPLKTTQLMNLEPDDIRSLTMEEFNQLYARIGSGPIPYGDYQGFIMQKPAVYQAVKKRILKQVMGVKQFASIAKQFCGREAEDCIFEFIWKGKRFYKKNDLDQILTQSTINLASSGFKFPSLIPSFLKPKIIDNMLDFAEGVIDKASITLFPMNTYCGISQVDTRRESIITDAGFADDFPSDNLPNPTYIKFRDDIISRKGLNITEEYRMVRPGLYIGKVYSNKLFLFNVALRKSGTDNPIETNNACSDGTRTR